ncbi:MAG: DMT family transporter [Candidatus Zixiibacteriota bacterium]
MGGRRLVCPCRHVIEVSDVKQQTGGLPATNARDAGGSIADVIDRPMTVELIDRQVSIVIYVLLCLIWGSTWMAIRVGLQGAPPLYAAAFQFVIATATLWAVVAVRRYHVPHNVWQLLRLSHPGVYMYCGSYALIYFAEQYISSALTSILFASFPLFVAMLSLKMLKAE